MSARRKESITILLVRWSLAAVFLYAGTVKLAQSPVSFADSVASFRLLPIGWIAPLVLTLPPFELLTGTALLLGRTKRLGAGGALLLGLVFLVALGLAAARGIAVDCGCFGMGPSWLPLSPGLSIWLDLGRDTLITAAAYSLYRCEMMLLIMGATADKS